eukprot:jgi/Mesen1/5972/ME000302S04969
MAGTRLAAVVLVLTLAVSSAYAQTEADVLNFALNLECLEAQFYSYAAYGKGLSTADAGNGPQPYGGRKALLSPEAQYYAEDIARDEIAHVRFLRAALGAAAVPCPKLDLNVAFSMAANFAFGTRLPVAFDAYGDDTLFYHAAYIFEDVGVTAYHGALSLLKTPAYIAAASGIMATEAYHAGAIRTLLLKEAETYVFPYNVQVKSIVAAISALRTNPGTGNDQGIVNGTQYNIVPADANAIVFSRTPAEVLPIVYLLQKPYGGFFPRGMNGNVK